MINWIWLILILLGMLTFLLKGDVSGMLKAMSDSAQNSVELLIALAGIMAVWSGIMKICEKSGIVNFIARILKYPMKAVFPGLDKKSPLAAGSIIMNLATNMMGLSNAATPFGIKAMEQLQVINRDKEKASDYMVTFLIINSACVQFIPTTVISIRASLNSKDPSDIIIPTIITTLIALVSGLIANEFLKKLYK